MQWWLSLESAPLPSQMWWAAISLWSQKEFWAYLWHSRKSQNKHPLFSGICSQYPYTLRSIGLKHHVYFCLSMFIILCTSTFRPRCKRLWFWALHIICINWLKRRSDERQHSHNIVSHQSTAGFVARLSKDQLCPSQILSAVFVCIHKHVQYSFYAPQALLPARLMTSCALSMNADRPRDTDQV